MIKNPEFYKWFISDNDIENMTEDEKSIMVLKVKALFDKQPEDKVYKSKRTDFTAVIFNSSIFLQPNGEFYLSVSDGTGYAFSDYITLNPDYFDNIIEFMTTHTSYETDAVVAMYAAKHHYIPEISLTEEYKKAFAEYCDDDFYCIPLLENETWAGERVEEFYSEENKKIFKKWCDEVLKKPKLFFEYFKDTTEEI